MPVPLHCNPVKSCFFSFFSNVLATTSPSRGSPLPQTERAPHLSLETGVQGA